MMRAARAHERHRLAELHHAFPLKHPGRPICAPAPGHSIAVQTDLAAFRDVLTVSDVAAPCSQPRPPNGARPRTMAPRPPSFRPAIAAAVDSRLLRPTFPRVTVIQELGQKAGQLPEFQRAALASKLLATLPPVLHDADDGVAEALRRDADLEADPAAGMSAAEFRTAVAASRRQ